LILSHVEACRQAESGSFGEYHWLGHENWRIDANKYDAWRLQSSGVFHARNAT